jgi:hypothetical protein
MSSQPMQSDQASPPLTAAPLPITSLVNPISVK